MNEIKELENLIDITCKHFKISKKDFKTKSRKRELSTARQMVSYIAMYKTNIRKRIVAKQLNRDRTGMYYYIKQHKSNMEGAGMYNKDYRDNYFEILKDEEWLSKFVNWELNFYKLIGYDIDFNDYVEKVSEGNKINYKLKNSGKIIPNFLVNKDEEDISFEDTFDALKIVGDFLDKTIVKPNNLNFPKTRFNFQNSLKLI